MIFSQLDTSCFILDTFCGQGGWMERLDGKDSHGMTVVPLQIADSA
jgi:hypothetical protein